MAKDHRRANDVWPDPAVLVVMEITPAYADGVKGYPHLVRPDRFLYRKIAKGELMLLFKDK